jgi:hypothetical protein
MNAQRERRWRDREPERVGVFDSSQIRLWWLLNRQTSALRPLGSRAGNKRDGFPPLIPSPRHERPC